MQTILASAINAVSQVKMTAVNSTIVLQEREASTRFATLNKTTVRMAWSAKVGENIGAVCLTQT